jgi:RNA polymerase sigma-70 factor (ECF subfamily)
MESLSHIGRLWCPIHVADSENRDDGRQTHIELSDAWRANRRYLLGVAFRMVGNIGDAEDVVQEAFARLLRVDLDEIDDVRGWLVVVVTRLSLNQLNSARHRHGTGSEPPEQADLADPADRVTLDDSIRLALLVVLERLSPAERATFVLHDAFQMPFDAIGSILGRSPAACRQLASRARRRMESEGAPARFDVDPADQRRVAERFIDACSGGEIEALIQVLDPDAAGDYDAGGMAVTRLASGRANVAKVLWRLFASDPAMALVPFPVNGKTGVLAFLHRRVFAVLVLTEVDGLITKVHAIGDPRKLASVAKLVGAEGHVP